MAPRIVPGTASHRLAAMISHHLDDEPVACTVNRFPDGELRPELQPVLDALLGAGARDGPR